MLGSLRDVFIRNLKFYRKRQKFSQEKLSYAIDMSMNYINQLENKNSFPPPEIIEKIARVLEIRPLQLFDENASPENIFSSSPDKFIDEVAEKVHEKIKDDLWQSLSLAMKSIFQ